MDYKALCTLPERKQRVHTYNLVGVFSSNNFNPLYIGFPLTVGSYMGMAVLFAKSNAFSANFTFCHYFCPLSITVALRYFNKNKWKGQEEGINIML